MNNGLNNDGDDKDNFDLLFGRLNGSKDSGNKRTVGEAYGDGTGYQADFEMLGQGGNKYKWTTLNPATKADILLGREWGKRVGWSDITKYKSW